MPVVCLQKTCLVPWFRSARAYITTSVFFRQSRRLLSILPWFILNSFPLYWSKGNSRNLCAKRIRVTQLIETGFSERRTKVLQRMQIRKERRRKGLAPLASWHSGTLRLRRVPPGLARSMTKHLQVRKSFDSILVSQTDLFLGIRGLCVDRGC